MTMCSRCRPSLATVSFGSADEDIGSYNTRSLLHFVVGKPAAFQALKPPAIERTFL